MLGRCSTLNIYPQHLSILPLPGPHTVSHLDLEFYLGEVHNYSSTSLKDGESLRFYTSALVSLLPTVQPLHKTVAIHRGKLGCDVVLAADRPSTGAPLRVHAIAPHALHFPLFL